ncbi:hypothetical protein DFH06DRAFT_1342470 [Mycena polygramma]|nr:hypothetical protein DFH06DRAFT_1342470 [Mycena polygramma]
MNYTVDPLIFEETSDFVLSRTAGLCAEMLLYGALLVLVSVASYLLYYWSGAGRKLLATATFAMVILATAHIGLESRATVLGLRIARAEIKGDAAAGFFLITNNIVTDSLFLYRCFIIWGRRTRVVAAPIFMLLSTAVVGYLTVNQDYRVAAHYLVFRVTGAMTLATNLLLMGLTAGRIWWIRRDACAVLDSADDATFPHLHLHIKRYNTAIAIMHVPYFNHALCSTKTSSLESGALNCLAILLYMISYSIAYPNTNTSVVTAIFAGALLQMMNIAPLVMIASAI